MRLRASRRICALGQPIKLADACHSLAFQIGPQVNGTRRLPEPGREAGGKRGLSGSRKASHGDQLRRQHREEIEGSPQIVACFLEIGLACFAAFLSRAVGGHHGTDGSAQGKKQRQSGEPAEIESVLAPPEVPVEKDIRRRPLVVAIEVHEKESKVVQRVDGRDGFIEQYRYVEGAAGSLRRDRVPRKQAPRPLGRKPCPRRQPQPVRPALPRRLTPGRCVLR